MPMIFCIFGPLPLFVQLSLFAESLYEMLQYQMGCRLLAFLQKLRVKFVTKRNQRKRQREETSKGSDKKSSAKRLKTDKATLEVKSAKTETQDAANCEDGKSSVKEEVISVDGVENENIVVGKTETEMKAEKVVGDAKSGDQETPVATSESKPTSGSESKENVEKMETKKSEKPVAVDKELLQACAFRFFDRNRVGYVRVEDMRLIIHNLGKFLSYRDVKELVQSALLESNTGRDDHILYNKLVRMADI
ncbi:hypothetical protein RHMOL_Rhmol09G0099900 [Rhododendron molle]|uniref:Uncharacterized protein n=2 Tax=Rhododendron molle TaxID=49168 RepID=A0ACC0MCS8_RHOML|nr:hypothetical protein RHMOL_Rhmol09G0099900 [Rhododendron molle]KAI8538401.1 hypothetical protein RHMOL_Rhmol09G0099900 [Rhododendron molle]